MTNANPFLTRIRNASPIRKGAMITFSYFCTRDLSGEVFEECATERVAKLGRGSEPTALGFAITESGRKVYIINIISIG